MTDKSPSMTDEDFQQKIIQLDNLIRQFEELPIPQIQEKVFEMLQMIDAFHREGLGRLVAFLRAQGLADEIEQASADPAIHTLLVLYDLIPGDPLVEAEKALDSVRPYIHSHGGEVELLGIDNGIVHLRLSGSCRGCAGSTFTLRRGIESALREKVPGFKGIENHENQTQTGQVMPNGLISFDEIQTGGMGEGETNPASAVLNAPVFKTAARIENVTPGTIYPVALENRNVLVVNGGGEIFAIGAECPDSGFPLTYGTLEGYTLTCPWHQEVFDIRNGKIVEGSSGEPALPVFPVAVIDDEIRVAVNVRPNPIR
jgi:nitrite reductase/ring-hydroxylating ferredoxin subunit/Fe-S cluster biogenesis protein NfuA